MLTISRKNVGEKEKIEERTNLGPILIGPFCLIFVTVTLKIANYFFKCGIELICD